MTTKIYHLACTYGLTSWPDRNALQRARRAFIKSWNDPGDIVDPILVACLAVAFADMGYGQGWIPRTQELACQIEHRLESDTSEEAQAVLRAHSPRNFR